MAASTQILVEQVVVLVDVGALGGRKFAAAAGAFDLSGNALGIQSIELTANRTARFARRKWPCSRIAAGRSCGTTASLQRAAKSDYKTNR
ncbi:hypothetical protein SAMN04488557_4027 [Hyphomicrobium facile]|uniref:Uncharacterized protein n=1 Tax=Hyphomicrobium facile TaxID=51670 RepID=A0A1I7NWM5_9HYPH|nr:hypothetical protein SAMN04488557_4027 [Hyphomicrobium facile]